MSLVREGFTHSETLFRALVESALVGIYVIQDGRLVYINSVLEETLGYTREEVSQGLLMDLVIPEDRALVLEKIRARESGEIEAARYTLRVRAKDGRTVWLEVWGRRGEWHGRPAIIGTALNITPHKETEHLRTILLHIGSQILHNTSTKTILKTVVQALHQHSKFRKVGCSLYAVPSDPRSPQPPIIAEYLTAGLTPEEEQRIRQNINIGKIIPDRRILETGQPIGAALYVTPERMPELPEYSAAVVPPGRTWGPHDTLYIFLRIGERIFGRIALADPHDGQIPTPSELEPLVLLAHFATLAIHHTRHLSELREQQHQMQSLIAFLQALNQSSTLQELLEIVIREAVHLIPNAQGGSFLMLNPQTDEFEFQAAVGRDLQKLQTVTIPYEHIAHTLGLEHGPKILTASEQLTHPALVEIIQKLGPPPASTISLPLRDPEGRIMGVLNINNYDKEGVFDHSDLERLVAFRTQLEIALARERDRIRLRELSKRDALTEVYNRRTLEEALECLEKTQRPFALVFVDIDDFYTVNDRFGHLEGDRVIQELASFLRQNVRATDGVYRYGGDEFVIVMEGANRAEAQRAMERLETKLRTLCAQWRARLQNTEIALSLGISDWSPEAPRSLREVLEEADQFMYRRKRAKKL
ncbi:MAG: diguanylate cyclase [Candidatus Bipolaricaulota bacterium]|nr:diguanylate cyclase [Candidatus Bipolaricaulota bacterium]MCS7274591.1 diguanylate cyclase [Candidatus Bipolaricaulota bacterium]MDW8110978.1 diguanylate cyclase [Candidatus Bipolaricaulota bacterium]MDW8329021.1 diguanylate cyclase [Candidatus Bipolaricaulota bacterium]